MDSRIRRLILAALACALRAAALVLHWLLRCWQLFREMVVLLIEHEGPDELRNIIRWTLPCKVYSHSHPVFRILEETEKLLASATASITSTDAAAPKVTALSNSMDISEEITSVNPRATNGTRVVSKANRSGKRRGSPLVDTQDDQSLGPKPAKRVSEGAEASANVTNPPVAAPRATAAAPAEPRHRAPFSIDEDAFLLACYTKYGNKYVNIFYAGQTDGLFLGRTQFSLRDRIRTLSKHQTLVSGDEPIPKEPKWQRPSRVTLPAIAPALLSSEAAAASLEASEPLPTAPEATSSSAKALSVKTASAEASSAKTTSVNLR